jgi:outer membrane protein assembly factor BamB
MYGDFCSKIRIMKKTTVRFIVFMALCGLVYSQSSYSLTMEGIFFPKENKDAATPIWRQAPGGTLLGVPAVEGGIAIAVLDGGNLKAYSLDGKPLWDYYAKSKIVSYVSRNREGTSYICRTDGILIAVNRVGRELWRLRTGIITSPVISGWDGRLFVTTEKKILCYTASGYLLWSQDLSAKTVSGPFLNKSGGIVAALEGGILLELGPFGALQNKEIGETPTAIIPVEKATLVLLKNGALKLFPLSDAPVQQITTIRGTPLGGVSRGNAAALLLANGTVVQVSLSEKKQKWREDSHIKNNTVKSAKDFAMLWDERGIYVFSQQGATGFNSVGKRLWSLTLNGASSIPMLADNGTLLSSGQDWILYAYKVENRELNQKRSLYGPAPEGNYGLGAAPVQTIDTYFSLNEAYISPELQEITVQIQKGRLGENEPFYTAKLKEIAFSAASPHTSQTHPPVQVQYRAAAARLLGYFASRETIPFLAELYLKDGDSSVRAAAAEAIGRIGTDPDGIALNAFAQTINATYRDEQVLLAVASAIGALCRFSGPPLSENGIKLLIRLDQSNLPAKVRSQARQEIAGLR